MSRRVGGVALFRSVLMQMPGACGARAVPGVRLGLAAVLSIGVSGLALAHHSGFQVQDARKKLDEALAKTVGESAWIGGANVSAPFVTRTRVAEMHEPEIIALEAGMLPLEVFVQDAILPNCSNTRRDFNLSFVLSGLHGEYATVTKGVNAHEPGKATLTLEFAAPAAGAAVGSAAPAAGAAPVAGARAAVNEPRRRMVLPSAEAQTHDFTRAVTRQHNAGFVVNPNKALVVRAYVAQWERLARFRAKAVIDGELTAALAGVRGKKLASDLLTATQRTLEIAGQLKSFQVSELVLTRLERDLQPGDCDAGKPSGDLTRLRLEPAPGLASLSAWAFLLRDAKVETTAPVDLKRIPGGALGFAEVGPGMVCYVSACGEAGAGARRIVRMSSTHSCTASYVVPDPACAAAAKSP